MKPWLICAEFSRLDPWRGINQYKRNLVIYGHPADWMVSVIEDKTRPERLVTLISAVEISPAQADQLSRLIELPLEAKTGQKEPESGQK